MKSERESLLQDGKSKPQGNLLCARSDLDWLIGFLQMQDQERFNAALHHALSAKAYVEAAMEDE